MWNNNGVISESPLYHNINTFLSLLIIFSICFIIVVIEGKEISLLFIERKHEVINFLENPPLINIIPLDPVKFNLKCPKLLFDDMFGQERLFHEFLMHSFSFNSSLRS